MDFRNPHFAEPGWLWLALWAPLTLFALQQYATVARRRLARRWVGRRFQPGLRQSLSLTRRRLKSLMLLAAVAVTALALARPQWGLQPDTNQAGVEDLVVLLDCSRSMLGSDVSPTRLERARLALLGFVGAHSGGRIGLVAFAGQAFLQCPLTFDHEAFRESLLGVDEHSIPTPGTDIGRALDEAYQAMDKETRRKCVLLVTDGEDLERKGIQAARTLAKEGVVIYTVGVGSQAGSEIRVLDPQGTLEQLRDTKGEVVHSRLDERTLRTIAETTGGSYHPLGPLGEGLDLVLVDLERGAVAKANPGTTTGMDRFHVPLVLATALLALEALTGTRKKDGMVRAPGETGSARPR
jgi:Ca-activated chloride channel family protein